MLFLIILALCFAAFAPCVSARGEQTNVVMLVPGFTVRELPLKLSNINNLRFTPDGKLSALGYDGRVHILEDTDHDGLEDRDNLFWDKQTLSVPVGMVWSANGLYVSSHGKVSLLRDTDHDGKADTEEIIANGWPPTDVASGGVDATAVTLDNAGNLYFGLLTADYSNPYRVKDGISHYDLKGKRGTIQKWNFQNKQLETIATGIRVPYTLAFNKFGDLFVTDQEGETWCPNGNPLDELNYIIPGRNYGFPPRHEKYLPDLISEAPVVGFAPQHQSGCGLVFNDPKRTQRRFGPIAWDGDAFIAGESRGKIWRVRLVKRPSGYIGRETIIARLNMLTTDLAISPDGHLYVSCHSGAPDWGTGPQGIGKIFKISYTDPQAPQPLAAWASSPMETLVAFDRPIDPAVTNDLSAFKIEFGEYVSAADRFEKLKPPYKVVGQQEATPRGQLKVVSAGLIQGGRALKLITDPHPQPVRYAITIPKVGAMGSNSQGAAVDLAYDLSGVEASWFSDPPQKGSNWVGWLPHIETAVCRRFVGDSPLHQQFFQSLTSPGRARLRTMLNLPAGENRIRILSRGSLRGQLGKIVLVAKPEPGLHQIIETKVNSTGPELLSLDVETAKSEPFDVEITYSHGADLNYHSISFGMISLPWAPPHQFVPPSESQPLELAGGDFERGRSLFFGEKLKCSTCHKTRGEGAQLAPDLSNLPQRDAASVLLDIKEPSARINPDYVSYNVDLKNGETLTGFLRAQSESQLRLLAADSKEVILRKTEINSMRPSPVSLMPAGLLDTLKEGEVRDLLTFLLSEPPTRSPEEIKAILAAGKTNSTESAASPHPLNLVLVASKQDHGSGQHDYPAWQKKWVPMFQSSPATVASSAWEWPSPEQFDKADAILFYFWNHDWSAERLAQIDKFLERGGGIVLFHAATIEDKSAEKLVSRFGLASQPGPTTYRHMPLTLNFNTATGDPIIAGFTQLKLLDEPYWPMFGRRDTITTLASADVDGAARPLVWTCIKEKGRVFGCILGHYTWTFDDPAFRILALRGIAWAAGAPVNRFEDLATDKK